jgi:hypothetical protein
METLYQYPSSLKRESSELGVEGRLAPQPMWRASLIPGTGEPEVPDDAPVIRVSPNPSHFFKDGALKRPGIVTRPPALENPPTLRQRGGL